MSRSEAKKQHYVPQVYLSRFAENGERIYVFDKMQNRVFPSRVMDVAQERYFYDVPEELAPLNKETGKKHRQFIEEALGTIEARFGQALDEVLQIRNGSCSADIKQVIAFMVSLQAFRTRKARDVLVQMMRQQNPDLTTVNEAVLHADVLLGEPVRRYAKYLSESTIWMLGTNPHAQPLYTSDNPVVCYRVVPELGFDLPIEVVPYLAFPLTPKYVLLFRSRHPDELQWDCQPYELSHIEVETLNRIQVVESHRQTCCHTDSANFEEQAQRWNNLRET